MLLFGYKLKELEFGYRESFYERQPGKHLQKCISGIRLRSGERTEYMRDENMSFGKYIRKKRLESRRQLTLKDMGTEMGISLTMYCDIEQGRKNPGEFFDYERLAYLLDLTEDEKALMYDLAAKKKGTVPPDIEEVMMYSESGNLARMALRMTNAGIAKEDDWKEFIRQLERKKREEQKE